MRVCVRTREGEPEAPVGREPLPKVRRLHAQRPEPVPAAGTLVREGGSRGGDTRG